MYLALVNKKCSYFHAFLDRSTYGRFKDIVMKNFMKFSVPFEL